jgi:hypothetical protein
VELVLESPSRQYLKVDDLLYKTGKHEKGWKVNWRFGGAAVILEDRVFCLKGKVSIVIWVEREVTKATGSHDIAVARRDTALKLCHKHSLLDGGNMTAQILNSELSNLIQESKRKHADLRAVSYILGEYRCYFLFSANKLRRRLRSLWRSSRDYGQRPKLR